jgi:hypothetical protein
MTAPPSPFLKINPGCALDPNEPYTGPRRKLFIMAPAEPEREEKSDANFE